MNLKISKRKQDSSKRNGRGAFVLEAGLLYCDACSRSEIDLVLERGYDAGLLRMSKMQDGVVLCEQCASGEEGVKEILL